MFTKDSRMLNHRLTVPLTSISKAVGDVFKPTFNQLIKSLFANNEQGFAYDTNDLSTMYQDATGTIPVTGAGQPVGLMLDKSKGLTLGAENVPLPLNFANWSRTAAVTSYTNNSFTVNAGGGVIYPFSAVQGNTYMIKIKGTTSSSSLVVRNSSGSSGQYVIPTGAFDVTIISPALFNGAPSLYLSTTSGTVTIESISMKQLTGNHAYQTTSASRPILRQNATTGAYYLEFDGSDDFLQTANINFTATDEVSLFAGVRKLSDAAVGTVVESGNNYTSPRGGFAINAPLSGASYGAGISGVAGSLTTGSISGYTAPNSAILTLKVDLSKKIYSDQLKIRINATDKTYSSSASAEGGNLANTPIYIGRRAGTSTPFNGHLYGLIGIGKLATDTETTTIEKELAKRVGATLNV